MATKKSADYSILDEEDVLFKSQESYGMQGCN